MSELTHLDATGSARMVDVSAKPPVRREAVATAFVRLAPETQRLVRENALAKGDVFAVARLAGIQAAKQTAALIPLCHTLALSHVGVELEPSSDGLRVTATARTTGPTGVEMEALTAASVAALAIYDMCKAVDKTMIIEDLRLVSKTKETV